LELTVHIGGLAAAVIAVAIGIGVLVYRGTPPAAANGTGAGTSRGERLANAIVAAAAAGGLLAALASTVSVTGQAPPTPLAPATAPAVPTPASTTSPTSTAG
jgi:hypothetical protein